MHLAFFVVEGTNLRVGLQNKQTLQHFINSSISLTNGVSFRWNYLFVQPREDEGWVWKTCLKTVIILAIPIDATSGARAGL